MSAIEIDNMDSHNDMLFRSDYQYLVFNHVIELYKNGNSTLLGLSSRTSIAGFSNENETTINVNKISYVDITKSSSLTKVFYWFIVAVTFLFTSLTILVEYSQDFDSAIELITVYVITLILYMVIYLPLTMVGYYYITREYLVLYSDNGSKIKINTKKITNYSMLIDLLKSLL